MPSVDSDNILGLVSSGLKVLLAIDFLGFQLVQDIKIYVHWSNCDLKLVR